MGPWCIVDWGGRGTHGAVYRAVQVDKEHSAPVALKLALLPRHPRFAREAELLARTRHPSIPRLWDAGEWQHPGGDFYPYLAMEWIDGVPLYAWARQHPPSPQQVLRLLAQLARALQSVHSHGAVHRDIKGDNILVSHSDGRAVLIDFGSGLYPDTPTLTPPDMYPGTPAYRSPESGLFELQFLRDRSARYVAGPADDLYALGVTACRLLTGEYPQFADPTQDEHGTWHMEAVKTPASLLQVDPPLRAWVLRMLSVNPEARGTAAQLAEELERAAQPPLPQLPPASLVPVTRSPPPRSSSREQVRTWWPLLVLAASALTLVAWGGWRVVQKLMEKSSVSQPLVAQGNPTDGGPAGLGDAASAASTTDEPEPSFQEAMTEETPPEPLPEQLRPNAKGRCPHKRQVALNGACWLPLEPEECEALGSNHHGRMFQGRCYVPALPIDRPSTSRPPHKQ